jgi:hypothetical protein
MLAGKSDDQACEDEAAPPHPGATHMRDSHQGTSPLGMLPPVPQRAESALRQRLEAVAEDEQPAACSDSSASVTPAVLQEQSAADRPAATQTLGAGSETATPLGQHPLLLHLPPSGSLITPSCLLKPADAKSVGR